MHREGAFLVFVLGVAALVSLTPFLPVAHVELVASGELAGVQITVGKGKHTLTELAKVIIGLLNFLAEFLIESLLLVVNEDLAASGNDALWCTLEIDTQVFAILAHVSDEAIELLV